MPTIFSAPNHPGQRRGGGFLSVADLIAFLNARLDEDEEKAEIIAGSIRSPQDVPLAFSYGADIVTIKYETLLGMISHPRTESTIKEFDEAWEKFVDGGKE